MGSLLVATTSGYELFFEAQTDLTLVTNGLGVVGGVLLAVATASMLLGIGPTERLLE